MFNTKVQKWGNSHAVRLPKSLLEKIGIKDNDRVEIKLQDGNILIVPQKRHKTLNERIADYKGDYKVKEWDTGSMKGKEVL